MITLSGFALSNEIGSSGITGGQQLPLCIFAAKFTKVPAGIMKENIKKGNEINLVWKTFWKILETETFVGGILVEVVR